MSDRLELPDELASLIEKREQEERREAERRTESQAVPAEDDRRTGLDRRSQQRRGDDQP
ncbi:hypothetical protein MalM25_19630 [Planctomycetes bacterium MalM25]|nr:hypothetical protein MalM25_19630 [Planctomycetes bacterium MalM25]